MPSTSLRVAVRNQTGRLDAVPDGLSGRPEAGFSLLEILIVLAVLSLAVGVVAPSFRGPRGSERLRPLALKLATDLKLARSTAILGRRPVPFLIDAKTHTYRVEGAGSPVKLPDTIGLVVFSPREVASGGGAGQLVFFPDGSSTGGRLTLTDQVTSVTLNVEWLTGSITQQGER